jgi:hypothetical protein
MFADALVHVPKPSRRRAGRRISVMRRRVPGASRGRVSTNGARWDHEPDDLRADHCRPRRVQSRVTAAMTVAVSTKLVAHMAVSATPMCVKMDVQYSGGATRSANTMVNG